MLIEGIVASGVFNGTIPQQGLGNTIITETGDYIRFRSGERKAWREEKKNLLVYQPWLARVVSYPLDNICHQAPFVVVSSDTYPDTVNPLSSYTTVIGTTNTLNLTNKLQGTG